MLLRNFFFLLLPLAGISQSLPADFYPTESFSRKGDILRTWQIQYDSTDGLSIQNESLPLLDSIALMMKKKPAMIIQVSVFESWPGPAPLTLRRTEYRARRISDYLVASGAEKKNIIAFGFGESQMIYTHEAFSEKTSEMHAYYHACNRRVEFKILDAGEMSFSLADSVFKTGSVLRSYEISSFPYAVARLEPEMYSFLDSMAAFLIVHPELKIEIGVHLDDGGYQDLPNSISSKRAKAIKAYLVHKGIHSGRLTSKGYKTSKPIVESSEIGQLNISGQQYQLHQLNRRTEFKIIAVN